MKRKHLLTIGVLVGFQLAAATCLNTCPFVPFDTVSADPELNVRLMPSATVSAATLQSLANAGNAALQGTSLQARYEVGERTFDVTPVTVQVISDKSFFTANSSLSSQSEAVAFLSKQLFTDSSGKTEVVEATVYVNLTASCGNVKCLNPSAANYAQAAQNYMLHEGLGHLFGLQDAMSTSSMMGPGNGSVNDITTNRPPSACDLAALDARKRSPDADGTSCGIMAVQ